jgi:hypothetical protein
MKHDDCQKYFEVYEENAQMLVLVKDGKLLGRAVVWTIGPDIYMDRVYTYIDYLTQTFINYAEDNK